MGPREGAARREAGAQSVRIFDPAVEPAGREGHFRRQRAHQRQRRVRRGAGRESRAPRRDRRLRRGRRGVLGAVGRWDGDGCLGLEPRAAALHGRRADQAACERHQRMQPRRVRLVLRPAAPRSSVPRGIPGPPWDARLLFRCRGAAGRRG